MVSQYLGPLLLALKQSDTMLKRKKNPIFSLPNSHVIKIHKNANRHEFYFIHQWPHFTVPGLWLSLCEFSARKSSQALGLGAINLANLTKYICVCMFYNDFHFSCWFTLIIGKYIQLHVCLALNKQSEGCWVSKDKWDITDVDKTYHHPESISLWNYIAMQKLFRVEIAVCVFNSSQACWGQGGSLMSLYAVTFFSSGYLIIQKCLTLRMFFFPLPYLVSTSQDGSP